MLPLVIGVQEACGRIGNITGKGLARNIEDRYSLHTLRLLVVLLAAANVINIGAIGVGAALIIHIPASVLMVVLAFHRVLSRCPRVRGGRRRWCRSVRSRPRAMSPLAPEVHGDRIPVRIARRICVRRRSGVIARDMTAFGFRRRRTQQNGDHRDSGADQGVDDTLAPVTGSGAPDQEHEQCAAGYLNRPVWAEHGLEAPTALRVTPGRGPSSQSTVMPSSSSTGVISRE